MKRDMDLIREILIAVSDNPNCDGVYNNHFSSAEDLGIPPHPAEDVAYHVLLLIQAGFLDGKLEESFPIPSIKGITWAGHELLSNIRNQEIWEITKRRLSGLSGAALSVMAQLAQSEIKRRLGLP